MSSLQPVTPEDIFTLPTRLADGEFRVGRLEGQADMRSLVGHCHFASPDAALLVSLLPRFIHVRGEPRLATLVKLLGEESRAQRPGREVILSRLLEVLFIEAFRSGAAQTGADASSTMSASSAGWAESCGSMAACNSGGAADSPGLLRGLADSRLAGAIRCLHERPAHAWTIALMAKEAALSRSAFFERFSRALGVAPMEYLLAWRMALAKKSLRLGEYGIAELAQRAGYSSASTFSVAFTRHVGQPPSHYARAHIEHLP